MNILIAHIHYPISSGRYIARAFERLGHDVKSVGPTTGPFVWNMRLPDTTVHMPDIEIKDVSLPTTVALAPVLDALGDWTPDLIITADSAFGLVGDAPCPTALWGVDNHVRDYKFNEWDYLFLAHKFGMRIGEDNVHWLPCCYDPELHVNTKPYTERMYHAVLLGVIYPERQILIDAIGTEFRILAGTGPVLQEYAEAHNQALVSVCHSAQGDVGQRIFESMAMGCIVLSDPCNDFEALGLEAGVHYLPYSTPDEAMQQLRELVQAPEERVQQLIAAGQEWVKGHTWDARAEEVLRVVFDES